MVQVDLGFRPDEDANNEGNDFEDDGYEVLWLRDTSEGDEFIGEAEIGEPKDGDYGKTAYLRLNNHDDQERFIAGLSIKEVEDADGYPVVFAWKGSVLYDFIDSLYSKLYNTKPQVNRRYKMDSDEFAVFQEAINDVVDNIKIRILDKTFTDKKTKETKHYNSLEVVEVTLYNTDV